MEFLNYGYFRFVRVLQIKGVLPWKPTVYSQPINIISKKYPRSESLPRKQFASEISFGSICDVNINYVKSVHYINSK